MKIGILALLAATPAFAQPCQQSWQPEFAAGSLSDAAYFVGSTPGGIAIAGKFGTAGTVNSSLVRWGATGFELLLGAPSGSIWKVRDLDPDGSGPNPLSTFAVGRVNAPGIACAVARWNGSAWEEFGLLPSTSQARAIIVHDDGSGPALYVGIGEGNGTGLKRWDGVQWNLVANLQESIYALEEFDEDGGGPTPPRLYMGAGGGLFRWDGANMSNIGLNGGVHCIRIADLDGPGGEAPALYVGGTFTDTPAGQATGLAKWDGAAWSLFGSVQGAIPGYIPSVFTITDADEDGSGPLPTGLIIGGAFTSVSGQSAVCSARWRGGVWSGIGGTLNGAVWVVERAGSPEGIYAGGDFTAPGSHVAHLVDGTWTSLANGVNNNILALKVMNLGDGPKLWAGGYFSSVAGGSLPAGRVATWDGQQWSALGGGLSGGQAVYALESFDDGTGPHAYAAGDFALTGGVPGTGLVTFDSSGFGILGGGVTGFVSCSTMFDEDGPGPLPPALFVGGTFTAAGGQPILHLARWDGTQWSAVGTGIIAPPSGSAGIRDMQVWDDGTGPALYVAGSFSRAGGLDAGSIAKWNGSQWSTLAGGTGILISGMILSLEVFNDGSGEALYAGGTFSGLGGVTVGRAAKWNGSAWSSVGPTTWSSNSWVSSLIVFDSGSGPSLHAAGRFSSIGGLERKGIVRLESGNWVEVGGGLNNPSNAINTLAVFQGSLYAGGNFGSIGAGTDPWIARWTGSAWQTVPGLNGEVFALAVYDAGSGPALYAGGDFTAIPGFASHGLARWNGANWATIGSVGGPSPIVRGLSVSQVGSVTKLLIGGPFTTVGINSVNNIARWSGTNWEALGSGLGGIAQSLAVFDDGTGPALYAAGQFTSAGGAPASRIAKWNGSSWSALGTGVSQAARSLCVFDDGSGPALYVGGAFDTAGGIPSRGIARWKNGQWSAVSQGVSFGHAVQAMAVYTDGISSALYVGGDFVATQPLPSSGAFLAKWTGSAWVPAPGPLNGQVNALTTLIDANGAQLYAAGAFTTAGGVNVNGVARWDGQAWSALGTGTLGINALGAYQDQVSSALFVGGNFLTAGGVSSEHLARWGCGLGDQPPNCAANCDGSTAPPVLNVNDFACFLNRYAQSSAYANCDQSTNVPILNVNDFVCFFNKFAAGCQ